MATQDYNNVDDLITKHLAGETSADEESRLLRWLNERPQNKQRFQELKKVFELGSRHVEMADYERLDIDVQREWEGFAEQVGARNKVRDLSRSGTWMRVAASLLLLIVASVALYYFNRSQTTRFQTAADIRSVTLPDGSQVKLNRYTVLTFTNAFGDKSRTVTLDGEAFFEVQPDAQKPFIVLAGDARVQVIGTSFDVNAYDSLESVEVVVETGLVSLQPAADGYQTAEIRPGERGVISKSSGRISISVNDDPNFGSWSTRRLVFVDSDLVSVVQALRKTYNADISIKTNVPPGCIVTVTFDRQSLESVMKVLENTLNLKYIISGNKVEITEAGC